MTSERSLQNKVLRDLKLLSHTYFFKKQAGSIRGIPDIILSVGGFFVALELKRSAKEKPTPLQLFTLREISENGGIALIVHPENWEQIYGDLAKLSQGEKHVQSDLQAIALRCLEERLGKDRDVQRLQKHQLLEESGRTG